MKNITVNGTRTEYHVEIKVDPIKAIDALIKDTLNLSCYDSVDVYYYIKDNKLVVASEDYYGDLEEPSIITKDKNKVELFANLIRAKEIIQKLISD